MARFYAYEQDRKALALRSVVGGDKRDRTADLLNAIQALSRLVRLHTPLNRVKRALQYAGKHSLITQLRHTNLQLLSAAFPLIG